MRILVCGGRDFDDWRTLDITLNKYLEKELTIIEGGAKGADFLARAWCTYRGVPYEEYVADWGTHGKSAGAIRNREMLAKNIDTVVAFPGGKGTANMVEIAKAAGVPVETVE